MTLEDYRWWTHTPLDEVELSVVIPAYNEAERILPTIGALASHLSAGRRHWELIVADDGSTDDTVALVEDLGLANLRVLGTEANMGKGAAVRRGVLSARGDWILFCDADQSTPIEQYETLLCALVESGAGVAIGSRAHLDAESQRRTAGRRLFSAGLRALVRTLIDTEVGDTQCGFKLFTREAGRTLCWVQRMDGFSFDLELLHLASTYDFGVVEVPVRWIDAPGSTVDPVKVSAAMLADLARIRINDVLGRYGRERPTVPTGPALHRSWLVDRAESPASAGAAGRVLEMAPGRSDESVA